MTEFQKFATYILGKLNAIIDTLNGKLDIGGTVENTTKLGGETNAEIKSSVLATIRNGVAAEFDSLKEIYELAKPKILTCPFLTSSNLNGAGPVTYDKLDTAGIVADTGIFETATSSSIELYPGRYICTCYFPINADADNTIKLTPTLSVSGDIHTFESFNLETTGVTAIVIPELDFTIDAGANQNFSLTVAPNTGAGNVTTTAGEGYLRIEKIG